MAEAGADESRCLDFKSNALSSKPRCLSALQVFHLEKTKTQLATGQSSVQRKLCDTVEHLTACQEVQQ